MPLSFRVKLFLKLAGMTQPAMHLGTAAEARRHADRGIALGKVLLDKQERIRSFQDLEITGRHGNIPIRIYFPVSPKNGRIVAYFHGGGFVIGNIQNSDMLCRRLSYKLGAVIVSVGYGLAPENKFPIPLEDCYDATKWVFENALTLGANPASLIVAGDSAGGNLAANVAIMARDSAEFELAAQVLIYPTTDSSRTYPSEEAFATGYLLTRDMMNWFTQQYMRTTEDLVNPLFSPLLTPDLSHLPPALVLTAGYDPLKDEGSLYAAALRKAGTQIELVNYPNMIHGFISFPLMSGEAMGAFNDIRQFIEKEVL